MWLAFGTRAWSEIYVAFGYCFCRWRCSILSLLVLSRQYNPTPPTSYTDQQYSGRHKPYLEVRLMFLYIDQMLTGYCYTTHKQPLH